MDKHHPHQSKGLGTKYGGPAVSELVESTGAKAVTVHLRDCYYHQFETEEAAAQYLAARSHHVLLHVEPIPADEIGGVLPDTPAYAQQERVRARYFELGGEAEED